MAGFPKQHSDDVRKVITAYALTHNATQAVRAAKSGTLPGLPAGPHAVSHSTVCRWVGDAREHESVKSAQAKSTTAEQLANEARLHLATAAARVCKRLDDETRKRRANPASLLADARLADVMLRTLAKREPASPRDPDDPGKGSDDAKPATLVEQLLAQERHDNTPHEQPRDTTPIEDTALGNTAGV